jgi:hypothetical protein
MHWIAGTGVKLVPAFVCGVKGDTLAARRKISYA